MLISTFMFLLGLGCSSNSKVIDGVVDTKLVFIDLSDADATAPVLASQRYQTRVTRAEKAAVPTFMRPLPQPRIDPTLNVRELLSLLASCEFIAESKSTDHSNKPEQLPSDSSASNVLCPTPVLQSSSFGLLRQDKAGNRATHNIRDEESNLERLAANITTNITIPGGRKRPAYQLPKNPRVQSTVSVHGLLDAALTSALKGGSELPALTANPDDKLATAISTGRKRKVHTIRSTRANLFLSNRFSLPSEGLGHDINSRTSRSSRPVATAAAASVERIQATTGGPTKPAPGSVAPKPTSTMQSNRSTRSRVTDGEIPTTLSRIKSQRISAVSSQTISAGVPIPKNGPSSFQQKTTNVQVQRHSSSPLPNPQVPAHASTLTGIQGSQISKLDTGVRKLSDPRRTQTTTAMPALASPSDKSMVKDDQSSTTQNRHTLVPVPQGSTPGMGKQTTFAASTAELSASSNPSPQHHIDSAILSGVGQIGGTIIPPGKPKSKSGNGKVASTTTSSLTSEARAENSKENKINDASTASNPSHKVDLTSRPVSQVLRSSSTPLPDLSTSRHSVPKIAPTIQSGLASMTVDTRSHKSLTSTAVANQAKPANTAPGIHTGFHSSFISSSIGSSRPQTRLSSSLRRTVVNIEASRTTTPMSVTREQASKAQISIASLVSQSRKPNNSGVKIGGPTSTNLSSRVVDSGDSGTTNTLRSSQAIQTKSTAVVAGGLATTSDNSVTFRKSSGRLANSLSGVSAFTSSASTTRATNVPTALGSSSVVDSGDTGSTNTLPSLQTVQTKSTSAVVGALATTSDNSVTFRKSSGRLANSLSGVSAFTGSASTTRAMNVPTVLGSSSVVAVSKTNSRTSGMDSHAATTMGAGNALTSTSSPSSVVGLPSVVAGSSSIKGDATGVFQPTTAVASTTNSQRTANVPPETSALNDSAQTTIANHVVTGLTTLRVVSGDATHSIVLPIKSTQSSTITDAENTSIFSSSQSKTTNLNPIRAGSSSVESGSNSSPSPSRGTHQTSTAQPSAFAIGHETFTVRPSRILVANQTVIPEGPAVSVNGTYVSLGKSDFMFGHRTETFGSPGGTSSGTNIGTTFRTLGSATVSSRPGSATASPTHKSTATKRTALEMGILGLVLWALLLLLVYQNV